MWKLPEEEYERLRGLWRDHTVREIAEITGKRPGTLCKYGSRHFGGFWGHSAEARRRTKEAVYSNVRHCWTAEARRRQRKALQDLRSRERLRERWGIEPKTRWRRALMPKKARMARYLLTRRYDYFCFDDEPYTLWYDSKTRRCAVSRNHRNTGEEYYTRKYGFKFKEAEEDEERKMENGK